jgi:hypothetical protein
VRDIGIAGVDNAGPPGDQAAAPRSVRIRAASPIAGSNSELSDAGIVCRASDFLGPVWQTLPTAQSLRLFCCLQVNPTVLFISKKSKVPILPVPIFANDLTVGAASTPA